ncbi:hypothetical protein HISP_01000 [Haloarcula hispanica N601]|uniref:DUF2795 domain-containing protein n=3 Tax=Haloarcula hispanica TaxID=51589 RepID=V5THT4_HALHI|nr:MULTISPECIES: hypothetical protein [Haloarcula]AHB64643.1 hypothetical protein HISP_01000 [Haloarcula hispanica N601]KAA9405533.1 DUF2795 domain-containing protein [Haloarcula sp. CBA1131]KAA9408586.1 DUF2795 domain-containing protein [Haloarcula hispanica]MUV51169.1 DUF2795 domain-containing protein [Haloarcula sp. CBA1122]
MRMLSNATDAFQSYDYPVSAEEIIEGDGDMELELPNGTERLGDALSRSAPETFESAEDAEFAAFAGVSSKAIGRKGYSDRDPVCMGEDGPDQVSF